MTPPPPARPRPLQPVNISPTADVAEIDDSRRRYFDPAIGLHVVQVFQGDYYVTGRNDEVLATVLGSCVAACIRDTWIGYGGMNHFLLPNMADGAARAGNDSGVELRYGSFAMEQLINSILARGGRRDRLEIKVFGGGNVVRGMSGVGHRNADFIEEYLDNEGLSIASRHLRGHSPRKIQYFPHTGRVRMRELAATAGTRIYEKEAKQIVKANVVDDSGTIELFD